MKIRLICFLLVATASTPAFAAVADLVKSSGIKGGLIVQLGCGDGRETAQLLLGNQYLVHGLDTDEANVREARKNIHALGVYGRVSAAKYDGVHLPYTDNFVNLLIAPAGKQGVATAEIMRVLAPEGVAYLGAEKTVKPWPAEIDQWTHFLHGPDNNAVAADSVVAMPRSLQWVAAPRWGRSHEELASMSAAVSANGRLFFIVDEAPLASIRFRGNWKLVARDAFNGTLLWKKDIPVWTDHLRHFRSGPVHLPRRLVAVGDRVYVTAGLAAAVTVLDAATGQTILTYEGTERTEEILVEGDVAYLVVGTSEVDRRGGGLFQRDEPKPSDFRYITAVEAGSGKPLWRKSFGKDEFLLPLSLAVKGPRLFYQSTQGVVCLDARSGEEIWKTRRETPRMRMGFSAPTVVATDDVLLVADRNPSKGAEAAAGTIKWGVHGWNEPGFPRNAPCTLVAYAVDDGKQLWSAPCSEGYNSPVDVFVLDGIAWVGTDFKGHDLKTGEVKRTLQTRGDPVGMPHHRCYRDKASERFIFTGRSGIELVSLEKGWLGNNSWVRGTCQYGIIPCNGLLYAPSNACACFLSVKAPGFVAVAPQRDESGHMPFPLEPILEKGPACAGPFPAAAPGSDQWPMYRHDLARSGSTPGKLPDALRQKWARQIGGRLTQPVIAGAQVLVAAIDSHTVYALSEADGKELWHYTAGGRIDSSPVIYNGRVYFGSADGWIYCIRATDGQLAWRFRAAPKDRLIGMYGQLESAWPVHGAVLIQNGTLYATAGRSSFTDNGLVLYRIDPESGKQLSRTVLYHLDPETGKQLVREAGFNMEGTTSDILSGDGDSVFLKHFGFDRNGNRVPSTTRHLFSPTGFLGEEWFVRSYWFIGTNVGGAGWGGWANSANANPAGRILCFDDALVCGYGRTKVANGPVGHRADVYHLFCAKRGVPVTRVDKRGKKRISSKSEQLWSDTESLTVRAMVLAGDRLVMAGPVDLGKKSPKLLAFDNEPEALAAFEGKDKIYLRIVSASDGSKVSQVGLDAMPVFDGMSAAGGKLYLSLKDGSVACFAQ